jgi:hypothetical protein
MPVITVTLMHNVPGYSDVEHKKVWSVWVNSKYILHSLTITDARMSAASAIGALRNAGLEVVFTQQ